MPVRRVGHELRIREPGGAHGRSVRFEGLDDRSTAFHARLTGRLGG